MDKRARRARECRPTPSLSVETSIVEHDLLHEIRHITQLAQAEDSRVVTFGDFLLFSTRTRDAWLLDPVDNFAACLCWDGESQPLEILDSPNVIAIKWTARFQIEGTVFVVYEQSGRVLEIQGYPTTEISAMWRAHGRAPTL